jgi:SAM-dependent methyltransferase
MLTVYKNVEELLRELTSADNPYHQTHLKRYGRTLSVLLDEQPTEGKLLEIGTSHIIPIALKELVPNLQVHVTQFDLTKPEKGKATLTSGEYSRVCPAYRVNVEKTSLPVADNTFDYVLCCEVLEHMEQDPMFMMSEINRVLKPDGVLILTTPNVVSSRGILAMLENREPYFYMQYRRSGDTDRHNYEYSLATVAMVLKASGFKGRGWTEDTFYTPDFSGVERLRTLGYELPHVGDNIFSVSSKVGPVVDRYPGVIYID